MSNGIGLASGALRLSRRGLRVLMLQAILAVVAVLALAACGGGENTGTTAAPASPPAPSAPAPAPAAGGGGTPVAVELLDPAGSGVNAFKPAEFAFSTGQKVTFTFTAETEGHSFTVDDLGIDEDIDAGQTRTFTFTFDKAGTFDLICIPHETLGMVGKITVQ